MSSAPPRRRAAKRGERACSRRSAITRGSFAMLSNGGALDGARILGPRTIAYMASDHLAPGVVKNHPLLWPGHGFGLGFCVRTDAGLAPTAEASANSSGAASRAPRSGFLRAKRCSRS